MSTNTVSKKISSKTANVKAGVSGVPSIVVQPSSRHSTDGSIAGDPAAASLYKSRRTPNARGKIRRPIICDLDAHQAAKCWAFANLVFSVLDLIFSLCEVVVYTVYTSPLQSKIELPAGEQNNFHWTFFLVSFVMHGDCFETTIEVVINLTGELAFVMSSALFAFATVLDKEYALSRCLVQWFTFTLWIPPLALIPRFILNIVAYCGRNSSMVFPQANENAPKIAFWIVNLLHVFFMLMWLVHGRAVALKFLAFQQEEEYAARNASIRVLKTGSADDNLNAVSSVMTVSHMGGSGDKALRSSGLGGMLPPSLSMV